MIEKNEMIIDKILAKSGHTITTLCEILDVNPNELLHQKTECSRKKLAEFLKFLKEYSLNEYLFD